MECFQDQNSKETQRSTLCNILFQPYICPFMFLYGKGQQSMGQERRWCLESVINKWFGELKQTGIFFPVGLSQLCQRHALVAPGNSDCCISDLIAITVRWYCFLDWRLSEAVWRWLFAWSASPYEQWWNQWCMLVKWSLTEKEKSVN